MIKIEFENGKLIEPGYVEINGVKHYIVPPKIEGKTPLSAEVLNQIQENTEIEINEKNTEINKKIKDEGWVNAWFPYYSPSFAFKPYKDREDCIPQYRKFGSLVEIRGVVAPKEPIEDTSIAKRIFTLPPMRI